MHFSYASYRTYFGHATPAHTKYGFVELQKQIRKVVILYGPRKAEQSLAYTLGHASGLRELAKYLIG